MRDLVLNAAPVTRVREFFLARQPILNRDESLAAYELLFRSAAAGPANVTDDLCATAAVIAHASELGMENVIGASRGFLNVDAAVLMSDIVQFLPKEKVVLEILETVKVTPALVDRIAGLRARGYSFALDDVVATSHDVMQLLPLADIIKVDIARLDRSQLERLSSQFKAAGKKLLAEKVENVGQFETCLELGFDYFQGYYFAKPFVLTGQCPSHSQMAIMQLMAKVASGADTREIEYAIEQDGSLGPALLRLVNSSSGTSEKIDSLGEALAKLGRGQVQRWLQILLYAGPGRRSTGASPLLLLATTRGKLLELMAHKLRPGNRKVADTAFTVGMMSLVDALFGLPMASILEQMSVGEDVRNALLHRAGLYGEMLELVECLEHIEEGGPRVMTLLHQLPLSPEEFAEVQVAAYEWSDSISRSAA